MGEAVKKGVAEGVWERSDLVITTKIFWGVKVSSAQRRWLATGGVHNRARVGTCMCYASM